MDASVTNYLTSLYPQRSDLFAEMEQFAKENRVPIMELTGIETMLQILRIQQPKKILEIGAAIGYSALRMADAIPNSEIFTVEMDEIRVKQATSFINRSNLSKRVKVIQGNALEISDQLIDYGPFDAIFIDAAKGQYTKFFELYQKQLSTSGCIFTDNVLFKGLVTGEQENASKRLISIANKLNKFNKWLIERPDFETVIIPVGDGLAVSRKIS